jgi:hypothetical protein
MSGEIELAISEIWISEFAIRFQWVEYPSTEPSDPEIRDRLWSVSADLVGIDPDWP